MAEDSFLTFEETMEKLGLSEEELLNMVAANELRAFMKNREMHFRESDLAAAEVSAGAGALSEEAEEDVLVLDEDHGDINIEDEDEEILLLDDEDESAESPPEAALDTEPASETVITETPEVEEEIDISDMLLEEPVLDEDSEDAEVPDTEAITQRTPSAAALQEAVEDDTVDGTVILDSDDVDLGGDEIALEGDDISVADEDVSLEDADIVEEADTGGSDVGLGTEEIVFEDDDLAIGLDDEDGMLTEEVTVQEDAISLEPDDDDEGLTVVEDAVSATAIVAEDEEDDLAVTDDEPEAVGRGGRTSARESARRRAASVEKIEAGSLFWAVPIAATFIISLLPLTVIMGEIYQGFTLKGGAYTGGEIDHHGLIPEMGGIFVPEHLAPIIGVDKGGEIKSDGAMSWMGEPLKVDNKITLKGYNKKYGKLPTARTEDVGEDDRPDEEEEEPVEEAAESEEKSEPDEGRRRRGGDKAEAEKTEDAPAEKTEEKAEEKPAEKAEPAAEEKPAAKKPEAKPAPAADEGGGDDDW
ncbi:MAG: hypothetical protein ACYTFY_03385 [Planctomycetota bacterium]|jgi:hypothetical protein